MSHRLLSSCRLSARLVAERAHAPLRSVAFRPITSVPSSMRPPVISSSRPITTAASRIRGKILGNTVFSRLARFGLAGSAVVAAGKSKSQADAEAAVDDEHEEVTEVPRKKASKKSKSAKSTQSQSFSKAEEDGESQSDSTASSETFGSEFRHYTPHAARKQFREKEKKTSMVSPALGMVAFIAMLAWFMRRDKDANATSRFLKARVMAQGAVVAGIVGMAAYHFINDYQAKKHADH